MSTWCIKLNAKSNKAVRKAVFTLSLLGYKLINPLDNKQTTVVVWSDKDIAVTWQHEHDVSTMADETFFYTSRKEFIAEVKRLQETTK